MNFDEFGLWVLQICTALFLLGVVFVSVIVLIVSLVRKKKKLVSSIIVVFFATLFILYLLFLTSHSTYYKYNDWYIMGNNIDKIEKKYGEFDYNIEYDNGEGLAGYDIDYSLFDYYMKYDSKGIVYKIGRAEETNDF